MVKRCPCFLKWERELAPDPGGRRPRGHWSVEGAQTKAPLHASYWPVTANTREARELMLEVKHLPMKTVLKDTG